MNLASLKANAQRGRLQAAALAAALILYSVHKSPSAQAVDVSVENVFDFAVPVDIIAQGVETGEVNTLLGDLQYLEDEELISHFTADVISNQLETLDWVTLAPMSGGASVALNTNNVTHILGGSSGGIMFNTFGSFYNDAAINSAINAANSESLLGQGESSLPFLNLPSLDALDDIFSHTGGTPSSVTPLSVSGSMLTDLTPENGFFVTSLTPEVLRSAFTDDFNAWLDNPPEIFRWASGFLDSFPYICEVINSHNVLRKLISLTCTFLFFFLMFKWWMRRIFYVLEIFQGGQASLDSAKTVSLTDFDKV